MTLTNVVRLNVYTTDVDTLLQHFTVGPDLLVALEATAMD